MDIHLRATVFSPPPSHPAADTRSDAYTDPGSDASPSAEGYDLRDLMGVLAHLRCKLRHKV